MHPTPTDKRGDDTYSVFVTLFVDVPLEEAIPVLLGLGAPGETGVLRVAAHHLGRRGSILDHLQVQVVVLWHRVSAQQQNVSLCV